MIAAGHNRPLCRFYHSTPSAWRTSAEAATFYFSLRRHGLYHFLSALFTLAAAVL
jgi:hypothetical protein